MILWSEYYPYKLVGLLSEDAALSQRFLQDFKRDVEAFWAASRDGGPKLKPLVKRCRLQQLFILWCIAYCASTDWKVVPEGLRMLLEAAFSGWLQSRVVEKGNKVLRDMEKRRSTSSVVNIRK